MKEDTIPPKELSAMLMLERMQGDAKSLAVAIDEMGPTKNAEILREVKYTRRLLGITLSMVEMELKSYTSLSMSISNIVKGIRNDRSTNN